MWSCLPNLANWKSEVMLPAILGSEQSRGDLSRFAKGTCRLGRWMPSRPTRHDGRDFQGLRTFDVSLYSRPPLTQHEILQWALRIQYDTVHPVGLGSAGDGGWNRALRDMPVMPGVLRLTMTLQSGTSPDPWTYWFLRGTLVSCLADFVCPESGKVAFS